MAKDKHSANGTTVSVMPNTLVLSTPVGVSEDRDRGAKKATNRLREAALFIRNFSSEDITFTAACSSQNIRLRCKSREVAAHDDAR